RLRTEITSVTRCDGVGTAFGSPCAGDHADYQGRAGGNRPKVQDPDAQIQQSQREEKENGDVTLGELKQPPHKTFTQIEETGMTNHSMMPGVKRLVKVFRRHPCCARAP